MARYCFAVDALGFLGEPLDERGTIEDFSLGFGKRLALFGGQDCRQIVGMFDHQIEPFSQDVGALFGGARSPVFLRAVGLVDSGGGLGAVDVCNLANHITTRRVRHFEFAPAGAFGPLAGQIGAGGQKVGIVQ